MLQMALLLALVYLLIRFQVREHRAYRAHQRAVAMQAHPSNQNRPTGPVTLAEQIPTGWSVERYAADGIEQAQVHLAQAARRRQDG